MKNLYLIIDKNSPNTSYNLLKEAAENRNIVVTPIYFDGFNFSQKLNLTHEDGIFRLKSGRKASIIEKYLINENVSSFYSNYLFCIGRLDPEYLGSSLVNEKNSLPIIKTIFSLTSNRELLKEYVEYLDGFPLIIKSMGGMHGVGVMKIDSFESLCSICDYLNRQNDTFIMRKFINHKKQARLIVLGDRVIASHANYTTSDFRTNVGDNETRKREVETFSDEIQEIAVKATNTLGLEFAGVDILFEEGTNNPYIAEVNSPCFFPTTQKMTGIDIAGAMVDFLIQKSETKK